MSGVYLYRAALHKFLTLKNSPYLNKYNFCFLNNNLILKKGKKIITQISIFNKKEIQDLCNLLINLEPKIQSPIFLLYNIDNPFFDTSHSENYSNTISLININSIRDFEKKINQKIEFERFRGNLYVEGMEAWNERRWINKTIKINDIKFKIKDNISRCSATNLQPNTDNITINLPTTLKKHYNHIDMGVYLFPLSDGEINVGDQIMLDE